ATRCPCRPGRSAPADGTVLRSGDRSLGCHDLRKPGESLTYGAKYPNLLAACGETPGQGQFTLIPCATRYLFFFAGVKVAANPRKYDRSFFQESALVCQ